MEDASAIMGKRTIAVFLAVLVFFMFTNSAQAEELTGNLVRNPGLELDEFDRLWGWETDAWFTSEDITEFVPKGEGVSGNGVTIINKYENDARYVQTISVEPDTLYRFSAYVKATGCLEGILGANLSIMGIVVNSEDVTETNGEWRRLELYGLTGTEQREVQIALRLGGYSNMTVGEASFDEVSFEAVESVPAGYTEHSFKTPEPESDEGKFVMDYIPLFILLSIAFAFFVYAMYRRRIAGDFPSLERRGANPGTGVKWAVAGALIFRMVLAAIVPGHETDMGCFKGWADLAFTVGPGKFYTSGVFTDYPPGYMYVLYVIGAIKSLLGIGYDSAAYNLIIKMPAIAADMILALWLSKMAREKLGERASWGIFAIVAFNPAVILNSSAWGQIDSIFTLMTIGALYLVIKDKKLAGTILYVLAVLIKPQALMLGPVFILPFLGDILKKDLKKALAQIIICGAAAFVLFYALILPFQGNQPADWIIDKYFSTAGSYPYASLNAFNFFSMLGANWTPEDSAFLFLDYKTWGIIFIGIVLVLTYFLYFKRNEEENTYLVGAFMIAGIYIFGHYMHERYIFPALILMLVAYILTRDKRLLFFYAGFSATLFVNMTKCLLFINIQPDDPVLIVFSAINTLFFMFFAVTVFDIIIGRNIMRPQIETARYAPLTELPDEGDTAGAGGDGGATPDEGRKACEDGGENVKREYEPIIQPPDNGKIPMTKRDKLLLLLLTVVYGVVAILNLGSTNVPETYWRPGTNEEIVLDFGEQARIAKISYYGGIGEGEVIVEAENAAGEYAETVRIAQKMDDMYNWTSADAGFTAQKVRLSSRSRRLWLYELAFLDEAGKVLSPQVVSVGGTPREGGNTSIANILDEPGTVAGRSYWTGMYFDEVYHARTAFEHLNGIYPYETSHPPLGKIIIAVGIAIFGMNPFGWRIMGTLFGIAMIPLLYFLALRLFKKPKYAFFAAALFAVDFMHFVQTRISTIDVYGVFFIIAMFYFMLRFYNTNFNADKLWKSLVPLGLAGLMFGIGSASKWIGIYAGGGLALMLVVYLVKRYREHAKAKKLLRDETAEIPQEERAVLERAAKKYWINTLVTLLYCVVTFIIIPVAIYTASYIPFMLVTEGGKPYTLEGIWSLQVDSMFKYHSELTTPHPFASQWWAWPFNIRPVWFYMGVNLPAGMTAGISTFGNPLVWLGGLVAFIYLVHLVIAKKIKRQNGLFMLFCALAANYLPWTIVTRATFAYHYFATVPFLILATVYVFQYLEEVRGKKEKWRWTYLTVAAVLFVMFYPLLSGVPIPRWYALLLVWLPTWTLFA